MTEILDGINSFKNTGLVHVGSSSKTDYLQVFNKKRKSRWDDNFKPYLKNIRKTRWGPEYEKVFTPLTCTNIPEGVDIDSFEISLRKYRLEDVNRRIQTNDYENIDPDLRSPSPEPIYDSKTGQRLNTRDVRNKEKYVKEKNSLIEELILLDKSYLAPSDYRPPKKTKKIYISEADNEKHKLVGLILGPGGVTQRELEKKSGCRVSVRGKGSNWTNHSMDKTYHDESDSLHVFLVADTEEQIRKGLSLVEPILDPVSEEHFKHKQMQKNAIAVMYGYQTETSCENCGEKHRTWACPNNFGNFVKADVKCSICGDKSHPTVDCPERNNIIDKNEAETDLIKFIREIDEFRKNAEILVLESERKADDIRNSVLFTGKIKSKEEVEMKVSEGEEKKDEFKAEGEGGDNNFNMENKEAFNVSGNVGMNIQNINLMMNQMMSQMNPMMSQMNPMMSQMMNPPQVQQQQPLDYKIPLVPIVDNPNVIRAAPVSYTAQGNINPYMINPQMNMMPGTNYYNMMNQFSSYKIPGAPIYHPSRGGQGLNFLSSNFQGKIPMSYGVNMHNYGVRPGLNYASTGMNIPAMTNMGNMNYRMNINQPLLRPNLPLQMNPNQIPSNFVQPPEPEEPHPNHEPNSNMDENNDDIEIDKIE